MATGKPEEGNQEDLIPSKDEIRKIMAEVFQAYPTQAPVILMQIEVARMMQRYIERLKVQLEESIHEIGDNIDKNM